ncbi:MAG: glycerophosphodiester phosphodiesterase [Nocardioidaceae bacterium]
MQADPSRFAYFDAPAPLALAHRGGATYPPNRGIENSARAFRNAVELGYRYLETDVYASRDGEVFAFHDDTLRRVTGEPGAIRTMTAEAVRRARVGGIEPIPRLVDLLDEFTGARFNIDVKEDAAVAPALEAIVSSGATDRVCLASFSHERLRRIRALEPRVPTSFSPAEIRRLRLAPGRRLWSAGVRAGGVCVQVPHRYGRLTVVTGGFVRRCHTVGLPVHVWTVDDADEIRHLLDLGVDGIVSDRIDVLRDVLVERGQWVAPADGPG